MFKKINSENKINFSYLIENHNEILLENFSNKIYTGYLNELNTINYLKKTEWTVRHYQSSKRVLLATLYLKQSQYLSSVKVQNLVFYCMYYSLFNALCSNIILLPYLKYNKIVKISHSSVFTDVSNYFIKYDIYNSDYINLLNELRRSREDYSYILPLSGTNIFDGVGVYQDRLFEFISTILQMSNLLSYISHYAWNKRVHKIVDNYDSNPQENNKIFFTSLERNDHLGKYSIIDKDDYNRMGNVSKGDNIPLPLISLISKLCEDLECAWDNNEVKDDDFDINEVERYIEEIYL